MTCCDPPGVMPDGSVGLNWRNHGFIQKPRPCRLCKKPAHLLDCAGKPCHKICAEEEATRAQA